MVERIARPSTMCRGALVLLVAFCIGCGPAGTSTTPANPPDDTRPSTSASSAIEPSATGPSTTEPLTGPSTAVPTVRCPAPPREDISNAPVDEAVLDQETIGRDVAAVQAYGAAHADEYGDLEAVNDPPPSRLRVAFTDHVAEHAVALSALVAHPERLDVVKGAYTVADLNDVVTDIRAGGTKYMHGFGVGWQVVDVDLAPGQEARADAIIAKWGNAVRIRFGALPYVPLGCGSQPEPVDCPDVVGADPAVAGIRLTVVPDAPTLNVSDTGTGHVLVENIGTQRFQIDSGIPIVGVLVATGSNRVVGTFNGGIAGVGGGVDLAPGETGTIDMLFGAARCDGQPGSGLPPGSYGLRIRLTSEGPADAGAASYLSDEVPITVTA
ncbi:MAG TPA: hypothetical protein VGC84_10825 [Ilumatobacteraceae bacterium]